MIECNLDDMRGEEMPALLANILAQGAKEAYFTTVIMKKGRPGLKLSVLAQKEQVEELEKIIFKHSTTLGVRKYPIERTKLQRKWVEVNTGLGTIRVKLGILKGEVLNVKPEFEDCLQLSIANDLAVNEVFQLALAAYYKEACQ